MMNLPSHSKIASLIFVSFTLLVVSGCGPKKPQTRVQPSPEIEAPTQAQAEEQGQPVEQGEGTQPEHADIFKDAKPIHVETGLASWYGPPYHNRKAANGEIFDMNQPTAAHKTLPLNSVVRVTNLSNGKSTIVRINDRGPFIGDRMIDLSLAAAKEIGVWRAGVAQVKIEVLKAPAPLDHGGRWCVQIGAFTDSEQAEKLRDKLTRKYRTAKVIEFTGPTGEWVRLRPLNDDRGRAAEVARETKVSEGGVFLVRLD